MSTSSVVISRNGGRLKLMAPSNVYKYLSDKSGPIVDNESGADDVRASVHSSGDERHLEQRGQLVEVCRRGSRMNEAALKSNDNL
jgi:hypothetical protein